jgi:hypothetical protein
MTTYRHGAQANYTYLHLHVCLPALNRIYPIICFALMSSSAKPSNGSKILSKTALPANEAKWTKLTKINWQDPSGKHRIWECAERSTRTKGGVDGIGLNVVADA